MKKVLYIDGVGPFGGASRSLFEVVRILTQSSVEAYFVAQRGTALDFYGQMAKDMIATTGLTRIDNSRYSHYRGVRWLVLLREVYYIPFSIAAIRNARQKWPLIDVIHVNEVMEIFVGVLAKRLFRVPMVVHVRSLQQKDERSFRTRYINRTLWRYADAVVAINQNTRDTLPADMMVDIIQNSFTPQRAAKPDPVMLGKLDALRPTTLKVGFVGNLHHSKGLFDLLEAAKHIRQAGRDDVEFVIVGGVTTSDSGLKGWLLKRLGLAQNVQLDLAKKVEEYGLSDTFHLFGATTDIQRVYERLDVITFPSHYDAPGRPVFEAAFSGVPSIVSVSSPQPDTLRPGETGLAIPAHAPKELANAILYFADHPDELKRMGQNARTLAEENFSPTSNAAKLLAIYDRVTNAATSKRSYP